jgi:hypothetical protein
MSNTLLSVDESNSLTLFRWRHCRSLMTEVSPSLVDFGPVYVVPSFCASNGARTLTSSVI